MKRIFFLLVLASAYFSSPAQDQAPEKPVSDASWEYHKYRLETLEPPYSLQKIYGLVSAIKTEREEVADDEFIGLDQKTYLSLSLREKFTYNMVHPESYSQNCDGSPAIYEEEKKIFGELPDVFGEYNWRDHQKKFFLANRDTVIGLMKECILKEQHIGLNFKQVIVDINAKELIPLIISVYNYKKKDHDLLTLLLLLMRDNEYDQFLVSTSYKKLYGDKNSSYKAYLNFNTENEALIIKRAIDFYNGLPK